VSHRIAHIRPATVDDIESIAQIHVSAWQRAYRGQIPDYFLESLDVRRRAATWLALLSKPEHLLLVATFDLGVVGFCSLVPSRDDDAAPAVAEIAAIYVAPDHWRHGAGAALVAAAVQNALSRGYHAISLWVLASNVAAHRFYHRAGFEPDGREKVDERPGYSLHEVRYRRRLG
jgi:GNAT superfamily N-acetyltransferase